MRPMDKITLRLSPSKRAGMTRFHLNGEISTRLCLTDVRLLWRLIARLSEQVLVVLPADAASSWFELWAERTWHARHLVRFAYSYRGKIPVARDGEQ